MTLQLSRAVEKELVRRVAAADNVFCFLDVRALRMHGVPGANANDREAAAP